MACVLVRLRLVPSQAVHSLISQLLQVCDSGNTFSAVVQAIPPFIATLLVLVLILFVQAAQSLTIQ